MNVVNLEVRKVNIPKNRIRSTGDKSLRKTPVLLPQEPDKAEVQLALDRILSNTRFQYDIKDEPGYFVVRIIDRDTDKVIREIPSKELQKIHESIEHLLGVLYDEKV